MMSDLPNCLKCGGCYTYENGNLLVCPDCGYEWIEVQQKEQTRDLEVIKDACGNLLRDGDHVTVIKDIKVKGTSSVIKVGLKIKNIRLVDEENGHNIQAKVPGFGLMMLKSEILKKVTD